MGIKYRRDARLLFFIIGKTKMYHFSYVDCWEPNFRNVKFLKSFSPVDFMDQLKITYNWESKLALQNNELHAKAYHKITFLITSCFRFSKLLCTFFFFFSLLKLSYLLRTIFNCVWVSKVNLLSLFIQSQTH